MAQAETARITSSQCNASYDSEKEQRDHKKTAHREGGSGQVNFWHDGTQRDSSKIQPREEQNTPDREGGTGDGGS